LPNTTPPSENHQGDGSWCPSSAPQTGEKCPLDGVYYGTCYWSTSSWSAANEESVNTQVCTCNHDGTSTFDCQDHNAESPSGAVIPANPGTPPPTVNNEVGCPSQLPMDGDLCPLSDGEATSSLSCPYSLYYNSNGESNTNQAAVVLRYVCRCSSSGNNVFSCNLMYT